MEHTESRDGTAGTDDTRPTPEPSPEPAPETASASASEPESSPEKKRRRPWVRRVRRTALVLALVLIVPLLAVETALRVNYMGDPAEGTYTRGRDAMWLGHAWVDGRKRTPTSPPSPGA